MRCQQNTNICSIYFAKKFCLLKKTFSGKERGQVCVEVYLFFVLAFLHTLPVEKSVTIVHKKRDKTHDHGKIGEGLD